MLSIERHLKKLLILKKDHQIFKKLDMMGTNLYYEGQKLTQIIDKAVQETEILAKYGLDGLIVENMHDLPYVQKVGPEILTSMTSACSQVRKVFPKDKPIGVQVLAGANKGALAVALAAELDFIRAEGFVFGHVADEGWMDAQAGDLLRYRNNIGANHIKIFTDINATVALRTN